MSKQQPLIGPRNADPAERGAYMARDFLMGEDVALLTAALSIGVALVGKALLKTETIGLGSIKKGVQSFVVISIGGMAASYLKSNMKK